LYIEEEQTTQWPKEKGQKDKQRSTKHTHKTKDRVTRTPLKTRGTLEQYADLPVANKMIKYTFIKCYLLTSSPLFFVAV
jgi:hypothetical protein